MSKWKLAKTTGGAPAGKATISRSATDHTVAPVSRRSNIRRKNPRRSGLRVQEDRGCPAVRRISQQALTRPGGHIVLSMHNLGKIVGKAASARLCLLATAACGILEKDQRYACPAVFILQDAGQNLTRFKPGPGRDITDIRFRSGDFRFPRTMQFRRRRRHLGSRG